MAKLTSLKETIKQNIKRNGNGEITGAVMQSVLLAMVDGMENLVSYTNTYDSGVTNVNEALDVLMDKAFYTVPVPVSVTPVILAHRNVVDSDGNVTDVVVNTVYDGMSITAVNYYWDINNYPGEIESIMFDGAAIKVSGTSYNVNFYPETPLTASFDKKLIVTSNYVDNHGVNPEPYSKNLTVEFKKKQFYITDTAQMDKGEMQIVVDKIAQGTDMGHTRKDLGDNQTEITTSVNNSYVYMFFPEQKSNIRIYRGSSTTTVSTTVECIYPIKMTEYDNEVTYYVHKTTSPLTGTYTFVY